MSLVPRRRDSMRWPGGARQAPEANPARAEKRPARVGGPTTDPEPTPRADDEQIGIPAPTFWDEDNARPEAHPEQGRVRSELGDRPRVTDPGHATIGDRVDLAHVIGCTAVLRRHSQEH